MEVLKCDVCGGRLVMQAGKIAKCEYCGLEYSTESLCEKVMEIKGTVNVQGIASAENILIRANEFYEHGDIDKALEYYDKYLDLKPQDEGAKSKIASINAEKDRLKQQGALCKGKVVSIKEFGVFVEFYKGYEGMIHISKLCHKRISKVQDVVALGDELWCVCMGIDGMGRLSYSASVEPALSKNIENLPKYKEFS